jgi:hypothetical protein
MKICNRPEISPMAHSGNPATIIILHLIISGMDADRITLSTWNINGWNAKKKDAISTVVLNLNFDIVVIIETHLKADDDLTIHDYKVFRHDRIQRHINARRNFGGIAVLEKLYFI